VSATVISRHYLGDFPAFVIPHYELVSVWEMIPYAILGVFAAFIALLFIKVLYKTEDLQYFLNVVPNLIWHRVFWEK
jgi:CIC family chloride channel protein